MGSPVGWWKRWLFVGDVLDGAWKGKNSKPRSSEGEDPRGHASWDCQWCAGSSPAQQKIAKNERERHIASRLGGFGLFVCFYIRIVWSIWAMNTLLQSIQLHNKIQQHRCVKFKLNEQSCILRYTVCFTHGCGCGSGSRVGCPLMAGLAVWLPAPPLPMSLWKTLNPEVLLIGRPVPVLWVWMRGKL